MTVRVLYKGKGVAMGITSRVLYEMIMKKELGSLFGYSAVNRLFLPEDS